MHTNDGLFVAVVDRACEDRVVWKALPDDPGYVPAQYAELAQSIEANFMAAQAAMLNYSAYRGKGVEAALKSLPEWAREDAATVQEIWELIAALSQPEDFELAVWTLSNNGHEGARRSAAVVLGNFLDRDLAWWTLVDALRDPVERVRGQAMMGLSSALKHAPRKIDWRPVSRSLSHLLNGTNIGAVSTVTRALLLTEVDPDIAQELLAPGASALLDYVGAEASFAHEPARKLLERLTDEDHGQDSEGWEAALVRLREDEAR